MQMSLSLEKAAFKKLSQKSHSSLHVYAGTTSDTSKQTSFVRHYPFLNSFIA